MQFKAGQDLYFVYIVSNPERTVLDSGATGDLKNRLAKLDHEALYSSKVPDRAHTCSVLLYWESFRAAGEAVAREREIRNWSLNKKKDLIHKHNPEWTALNERVYKDNYSFLL